MEPMLKSFHSLHICCNARQSETASDTAKENAIIAALPACYIC